MTKIKICGLTRMEDIDAANLYMPDYIGFVFAESRRKVDKTTAKTLKNRLDPRIKTVGVFVNEPIENILSLIENGVIDIVQLHSEENEKYIENLKSKTGILIIKAISVQNKGGVQKWNQSSADYLLLDHKNGGSGQIFDWNLIGETTKPFFLAGGINIENVTAAINKTNPYAVDISSGAETNGIKDSKKIKEFIGRVRNG